MKINEEEAGSGLLKDTNLPLKFSIVASRSFLEAAFFDLSFLLGHT